ncbi:MAG TPA: DUF4190 domain-containing protein [Bacteroidia bacterium]|nr:DUF4190 domain-containing protein [Bacteroidia bacterium]
MKIAPLPVSLDSCGDQIVFRNGDELDAQILEIGSDYIKYKTCDNLSGPLRVSSLEKIFMLRFMDGKRKLIEQKKSIAKSDQGPSGTRTLSGSNHTQRSMGRNNSDKLESGITSAYAPVDHQKKRELYTGALGAFILSLFSWTLILAPVAFILSILSLNKINQEPDKYKGTGFALFGLIISLIAMLMILSLIF